MKYIATVEISVDEGMGWDEVSIRELIDEELSHFGDMSATVKVRRWDPPPPRTCQNCGGPDEHDDHWTSLDGPNREGYTCRRELPL